MQNLNNRSDFQEWIRKWYLTGWEYKSDSNGCYYVYRMYNGRKWEIWTLYDFIAGDDSCYELWNSWEFIYIEDVMEFKKLLLL